MDSEEFAAAVNGVGALAEPVRRRLYLYVASQPEPVSREQAAEGCGVAVHSAKFHLDRLVDEGLLEAEFRRLSGRSGPGAGRPSKLYRRSEREVSVVLPERRYDLAGDLLAAAYDEGDRTGAPQPEVLDRVATSYGRDLAVRDDPAAGTELERAGHVLARHGYEPHVRDREVCLANCPFDRLARKHTALVCGMNLALVSGMLDGMGCRSVEAVLQPDPELCCVRARRS